MTLRNEMKKKVALRSLQRLFIVFFFDLMSLEELVGPDWEKQDLDFFRGRNFYVVFLQTNTLMHINAHISGGLLIFNSVPYRK